MSNLTYNSEQIERIRKKWLTSFYVFYTCNLFIGFFRLANFINIDYGFFLNIIITAALCILILLILYALPLYYFAYIKRGTRFIVFILIMSFSGISKTLNEFTSQATDCWNGWLLLLGLSITIYFLINSYQLYKANKAYNLRKSHENDVSH